MSKAKKVLICGNEAIGEAAIIAGCQFYAGYPITPQNELTAYMSRRMPQEKRIFVQSESEIAAINMVFGASAAGFRAMTTSSSPGISLKQEGISYLAGCQLPAVIVNIMRGGPGLGNIAPAQSDYFQATKGGGHGDYRSIVLAPATVQETFGLVALAFDLSDRYRTPAIILGDGMLGQMMEPATLPPAGRKQTRITASGDWALGGCKGRAARRICSLFLKEGALEKWNQDLKKKYDEIEKKEKRWEALHLDDAKIILIAYGTVSRICKAALIKARKKNLKVGLIRPVSLWPFPSEIINQAAKKAKAILVVEMSHGQMVEDVRLAVSGRCSVDFYGRSGGGIPDEGEILKRVKKLNS